MLKLNRPLTIPTDQSTLGYLAGLVDGEGCIGIVASKSKKSVTVCYSARISIANTNPILMEWLSKTVGGYVCATSSTKPGNKSRNPKHKQGFVWVVSGKRAARFAEAVLPWLLLKREQAMTVISLSAMNNQGRRIQAPNQVLEKEQMKARMHLLNRKGVDVVAVSQ